MYSEKKCEKMAKLIHEILNNIDKIEERKIEEIKDYLEKLENMECYCCCPLKQSEIPVLESLHPPKLANTTCPKCGNVF